MKRRPFTLAEVLVAVLVAAVVIPVALRALMTVAMLDEADTYRRRAASLADLKLREIVVTGEWADPENNGDFGEDYPGYTWELASDEWTAGEALLRRLDLSVQGPGRFGPTTVTLTTLVPELQE